MQGHACRVCVCIWDGVDKSAPQHHVYVQSWISIWHLIAMWKHLLSQNALLNFEVLQSVNYSMPEAISIPSSPNSQIYSCRSLHFQLSPGFQLSPTRLCIKFNLFISPVCCTVVLWAQAQIIFSMFCHRNLWSNIFFTLYLSPSILFLIYTGSTPCIPPFPVCSWHLWKRIWK